MSEQHIVIPSKEQILTLLHSIELHKDLMPTKTIGELIGMKWVDSLLPKIPIEPDWGYDGLVKFCADNGLERSDTIEDAIKKLS